MADPTQVQQIPWGTIAVSVVGLVVTVVTAVAGLLAFVVKLLKSNAKKDKEIGDLYKAKYKGGVITKRVARVELERARMGKASVPPPPMNGQDFSDDTAVINGMEREDAPFYAELEVPLRIQPGMPRMPRLEGLGGRQDYVDYEIDQLERGHVTPTQIDPPLGGMSPGEKRRGGR